MTDMLLYFYLVIDVKTNESTCHKLTINDFYEELVTQMNRFDGHIFPRLLFRVMFEAYYFILYDKIAIQMLYE